MKLFKNKIFTLFCAALIAVFLVASTPKPKEAHAIGFTALIAAAIAAAQKAIVGQLMSGFTDLAGNFGDLIMDQVMPFKEDMWQKFATEQRAGDIEMGKQLGEVANATANQDFVARMEDSRYEDAVNNKVSDGECQLVTGALLVNGGGAELEKNKDFVAELIRKDKKFVNGGATAAGPIVAHTLMKKERFEKFCSDDEHRGNIKDVCTNADPKRVDKDKAMEKLIDCSTIARSDIDAFAQMMRYAVSVTGESPLPKAFDDPAVSDVYLQREQQDAKLAPDTTFIETLGARALEPETCPAVPGGDSDRLSFVNAIDLELGNVIPPNRPCPGQAEMECYFYQYQFDSPQFALKCNEGEAQVKRCEVMVNAIVARTNHEIKLLANRNALATGNINRENASYPSAPIQ